MTGKGKAKNGIEEREEGRERREEMKTVEKTII
jgi:hypothetical protein